MSLEHSPARARKKAAQATSYENDDEVLTIPQWAKLNTFSLSTAYRILNGPKDQRPEITQLSDKRIGITRGTNRRWQQKKAR